MRIAISQARSCVGDVPRNFEILSRLYGIALQHGANLLVTSELFLEGYPLYDWVQRPEILSLSAHYLSLLQSLTLGKPTQLAVGHMMAAHVQSEKPFHNTVSIFG